MTKTIEEAARKFATMQWGKTILHTTGAIESLLIEFASELMKLPLADRLTESEKEKIREQYDEVRIFTENIDPCEEMSEYYLGQKVVLERIFGKELFERKEE
jgi:hypothetical protein